MTIHFELASMVTATLRSPESHLTQTHTEDWKGSVQRQNTNLTNARSFSTALTFQLTGFRNDSEMIQKDSEILKEMDSTLTSSLRLEQAQLFRN